MIILPAVYKDLNEIVKLHQVVFPGFFLTKMGKPFLMELYKSFLMHDLGVLLVTKCDDEITGFIAGATNPSKFFSDIKKKRAFFFLIKSFYPAILNPRAVIYKLYHAVKYRGDTPKKLNNEALLSSLGVSYKYLGTGTAHMLVAAFENEVLNRGFNIIYLTTDALQNERVNNFYKKINYLMLDSFHQDGKRKMFRYKKNLIN